MGYGFSLPDNPADHFRIDFSPAIAAYIKTVKDRRSTQDQEPATLVREDMSIHWVRVRENVEFSPCFLEEFSIAIENPRERLEADANLHSNPSVLNAYPSRNKLHVICAVLMIIQKGQTSIRKHNRDLPEHPQNTKQVDAARYRQNQLHTLNYAFESLKSDLISLLSTGTDACQSFRILRLEDLLTETPEKLKKDIRSVLNAGLKTRDPRKIRERGGTDFAYTIWLCGLLMNHRQDIDKQEQAAASESTFDSQCSKWLRFLHQMYPPEEITLQRSDYDSNAGSNGDRATWFDPVRNSGAEGDGTAEVASTVASYLDAIRTCTERHPQSLYNDLEVTPGRLTWCYNVVRNEGVWVPNMQDGEEDDEWMLYLECGDT